MKINLVLLLCVMNICSYVMFVQYVSAVSACVICTYVKRISSPHIRSYRTLSTLLITSHYIHPFLLISKFSLPILFIFLPSSLPFSLPFLSLFFIIAFMGVAAMFLKTLRIFVIVKSVFKRRKFTGRGVLTLSALCYVFWVSYLAFCTSVYPPVVVSSSVTAVTGQVTIIFRVWGWAKIC